MTMRRITRSTGDPIRELSSASLAVGRVLSKRRRIAPL
jgi:hypothetical protein